MKKSVSTPNHCPSATMNPTRSLILGFSLAGLLALDSSGFAATTTWNGSTGDWATGGNWSNGTPDVSAGDTAIINAGTAQYNPGGDLSLSNGSAITINGGGFTQLTGAAWIKIGTTGTGTVTVNSGGTFDSGTSTNVFVGNGGTGVVNVNGGSFLTSTAVIVASGSSFTSTGSTSVVTIGGNLEVTGTVNANGGAFSFNNLILNSGATFGIGGSSVSQTGNLNVDLGRTFTVSGGSFALNGELKPTGGNVVVSGGHVTANLISFDGVPADTVPLALSGGILEISGNFNNGIWNSAGSYVNFTTGSSAQLIFTSVTASAITGSLGSTIKYNGTTDTSQFVVTTYGGSGSMVTLLSIPEPSTYAALFGVAALGCVTIRRRRL